MKRVLTYFSMYCFYPITVIGVIISIQIYTYSVAVNQQYKVQTHSQLIKQTVVKCMNDINRNAVLLV